METTGDSSDQLRPLVRDSYSRDQWRLLETVKTSKGYSEESRGYW